MDITPQDTTQQQPISDDQELAKALAGVMPDVPEALNPAPEASAMQFEETIIPTVTPLPDPLPEPTPVTNISDSDNLEAIKQNALEQLRPLIGKVDLPAEEKFDIYLMLIRSTDDSSLIAPASVAAQNISDEKRRAEALLDIIKEIDYLSRNRQATA